ncbi:hypothetical protein, partial [Paracoccus liaowanqingii]|uniref:hypothetical protein n=1 Tax=Paracoccus liaowanqingii TaxID=2560053 RepID=UPI00197FFFBC
PMVKMFDEAERVTLFSVCSSDRMPRPQESKTVVAIDSPRTGSGTRKQKATGENFTRTCVEDV